MADILSLIKETNAYKSLKNDKTSGKLSHAYLILCPDGEFLSQYLKIFVKLIACGTDEICGECRACRLIDEKIYPDVSFYPERGETVTVGDVTDLIEKSYLKPVEGERKIFVIENGDTMTAAAQNKLLKTLEEPPVGTHIVIGAKSEFPLLSTLKSRVKKLEIPAFSEEKLFRAFSGEFTDKERLKRAVACGDGTAGAVKRFYSDEKLKEIEAFTEDMLVNMQSSSQVLDYSVKLDALLSELIKEYRAKNDDKIPKDAKKSPDAVKRYCLPLVTEDVLFVMEAYLRDMLCLFVGAETLVYDKARLDAVKNARGYTSGALVYALDKINEARKRKYFNGSGAALNEWLLFSILEGKYKWQR